MFRPLRTVCCVLYGFTCCVLVLSLPSSVAAQKQFTCPDGEVRLSMDPSQIAIQYEGTAFAGAIGKMGLFSANLSVAAKQLQQAAAATQQWNELVKGLVAGWNSCAIGKDEYSAGLQRIYPKMVEDAEELDRIATLASQGQPIRETELTALVRSYMRKLAKLAEIAQFDSALLQTNGTLRAMKANTDELLIEIREVREACVVQNSRGTGAEARWLVNYPSSVIGNGSAFQQQAPLSMSESYQFSDQVQAVASIVGFNDASRIDGGVSTSLSNSLSTFSSGESLSVIALLSKPNPGISLPLSDSNTSSGFLSAQIPTTAAIWSPDGHLVTLPNITTDLNPVLSSIDAPNGTFASLTGSTLEAAAISSDEFRTIQGPWTPATTLASLAQSMSNLNTVPNSLGIPNPAFAPWAQSGLTGAGRVEAQDLTGTVWNPEKGLSSSPTISAILTAILASSERSTLTFVGATQQATQGIGVLQGDLNTVQKQWYPTDGSGLPVSGIASLNSSVSVSPVSQIANFTITSTLINGGSNCGAFAQPVPVNSFTNVESLSNHLQ
jgi:hypothetical protein